MAKKTLDLVIEHTKELYKFDTSFFIQKIKIPTLGGYTKKNKILKFFEIRDGYIDANQN